MQEKNDKLSPEETKQRLQKTLQGAFSGPPTPLKDIPTRFGVSRKLARPADAPSPSPTEKPKRPKSKVSPR